MIIGFLSSSSFINKISSPLYNLLSGSLFAALSSSILPSQLIQQCQQQITAAQKASRHKHHNLVCTIQNRPLFP